MKLLTILALVLLTGCGSQSWRLGTTTDNDVKYIKKRDKERDRILKETISLRKKKEKHYIKQHKKKDGKLNLFKRDGYDWGFWA